MAASTEGVVFMTTKNREMFPVKMAQDRFGNELNPLKGAPHRGPGCYDNEEKTNFIYQIYHHLTSSKGYTMGARTGPRFAKESNFKTPCPTEYQQHCSEPCTFEPAQKPFEVGSDRFPIKKRDITEVVPGAGAYEHIVPRNRKIQWHQSFGGAPILLPSITVRSTIDKNTEKLYSTKEERKYHRKLAYLKLYH